MMRIGFTGYSPAQAGNATEPAMSKATATMR
jgi:hypothetical protein